MTIYDRNDVARRRHRKEQEKCGPLYGEVEGCPLHDLTYFHGDQSRHDGADYPPCKDCGETVPDKAEA